MRPFQLICSLFLLPIGAVAVERPIQSEPVLVELPLGLGPTDNPLKGWCQYPNLNTPAQQASMVFHYASWRQLEPQESEYAFEEWEANKWSDPQHADKHVVLRVFIDYPKQESGLPEWLIAKGVTQQRYENHGGGMSPDYDHPAMRDGITRLIMEMGKRYNLNPRVAFIEIGMLGHWGEWHTYPRNELFASTETQREVIDTFHRAFPNKHLMARTADDYPGTLPWIGYHDDLFPDDTDNGHGWSFLAKIREAKRDRNWRVAPIGGEMVPGEAKKWMGDRFGTTMEMVERSHFSWVGPYGPQHDENPTDQCIANCETMVRRMGYEFRLTHLRHPPKIRLSEENPTQISLRGESQGVAPFYYPWQVQFALLDTDDQPKYVGDTAYDIRRWQPENPFIENGSVQFRAVNPNADLETGQYRLAIGIIDPWKKTPRIQFANDLPVVAGWTVLSEIRVSE